MPEAKCYGPVLHHWQSGGAVWIDQGVIKWCNNAKKIPGNGHKVEEKLVIFTAVMTVSAGSGNFLWITWVNLRCNLHLNRSVTVPARKNSSRRHKSKQRDLILALISLRGWECGLFSSGLLQEASAWGCRVKWGPIRNQILRTTKAEGALMTSGCNSKTMLLFLTWKQDKDGADPSNKYNPYLTSQSIPLLAKTTRPTSSTVIKNS